MRDFNTVRHELVSMPKWLYDKWVSAFPWAVNGATIEEGDVEK